ncbi:unnamed protein product [Auanema sp. JU1783]|nr:unnamed protein product [Auanema sp. JU1783]
MYLNMQEKDMLDDFPLPPPPNIQQQVIDIRSGVVLHSSQNAKPARYMGCSAHVLLILILLAKSALFSAWLWREYENFGVGCSFLIQGFHDISSSTADHHRPKRSNDIVDILDPRIQSFKPKNPQSTVITMTNTQILPVVGAVNNPLKIKTIRQRVENIQPSEEDIEDNSEETVIYISPIVNRLSGLPDPLRKNRKGKGKGRKTSTTTTTEAPVTKKKKKERKNKKNRKKNRKDGDTDQTKAPRHLFTVDSSPVTTIGPQTTQRQQSVPNQGHIRSFKMQKANQKPKKPKDNSNDGIKLSKATRLMWEMDELNFTTFATSSLHSSSDKRLIADDNQENNIEIIQKDQIVVSSPPYSVDHFTNTTYNNQFVTTTTSSPIQLHTKKVQARPNTVYYDDDDLQVILVENKNHHSLKTTTQQPVAIYYESVKATPPSSEWFFTTLNELQRHASSFHTTTPIPTFPSTKRPRPIKHGFDRSQDKSIDEGFMDFPSAIAKPRVIDENQSIPFQDQLSSFTISAVCVARALFDVWCVCQLLTAFPFCLGICLARRALFVAHLVLDILFLVIGFIFSITTIVFSIILYVLVGEMRRSTLFYWLLFAVIVDVVLVAYSATVIARQEYPDKPCA